MCVVLWIDPRALWMLSMCSVTVDAPGHNNNCIFSFSPYVFITNSFQYYPPIFQISSHYISNTLNHFHLPEDISSWLVSVSSGCSFPSHSDVILQSSFLISLENSFCLCFVLNSGSNSVSSLFIPSFRWYMSSSSFLTK